MYTTYRSHGNWNLQCQHINATAEYLAESGVYKGYHNNQYEGGGDYL